MPDSDLTLYARWNEIPVAQTGKVIITKQVVDTDGNDLIPTGEFTFNVKKDDEIVGHDSLRYGGTKLTTATINLEEGSYNLSEDLDKAMSAIPGYELVVSALLRPLRRVSLIPKLPQMIRPRLHSAITALRSKPATPQFSSPASTPTKRRKSSRIPTP